MIKIENYTFKKVTPKGKYRMLLEDFLESNEKTVAWKCADKNELHASSHGFGELIRKRKLQDMVKLRMRISECIVGLEKVNYEPK